MSALPSIDLHAILERADHHYYVLDDPIYTNTDYDQMCADYERDYDKKWEPIGAADGKKLKKFTHIRPMKSLDKIRTAEELRDKFILKFQRPTRDVLRMIITPKIDGLAISAHYKEGVLQRVVTRGDGEVGEDITHNMKSVMPNKIANEEVEEVRGEAYMTWVSVEELNVVIAAEGGDEDDLWKNPRNAVAGIVRRDKSADVVDLSHVKFAAYGLFGGNTHSYYEDMGILANLGFEAPSHMVYGDGELAALDTDTLITHLSQFRASHYPIDGAVIRVDSNSWFASTGQTSHHPNGAIAFKFPDEIKDAVITEIKFAVGRTGPLTPTLWFTEVQLEGTTVKKATGCNLKRLHLYNLKVGDTIGVRKAGCIIPEALLKVGDDYIFEDVTTGKLRYVKDDAEVTDFALTVRYTVHLDGKFEPSLINIDYPRTCPSCGHATVVEWPHLKCKNGNCGPKLVSVLTNLTGRAHLDIRGFGKQVAVALVNAKLVDNPSSIWSLFPADWESLVLPNGQLFGAKRAATILEGLAKAKEKDYQTTLHGLGCPGLGSPEIKALDEAGFGMLQLLDGVEAYDGEIFGIAHEGDLDFWAEIERIRIKKMAIMRERLIKLKGIGPKTADALMDWLVSNMGWLGYHTLHCEAGNGDLNLKFSPKVDKGPQPLAGLTLVLTGNFPQGARPDLEKALEALGAKAQSSVSKKTGIVCVGADAGSKEEKARLLSVKMVGPDGLDLLLQGIIPD